jgi:hypothetical protein
VATKLLLSLVVVGSLVALPQEAISYEPEDEPEASNVVKGSFDGLDLKKKKIWIGDMIYLLDDAVTVQGTSVKLGLITDLKQGEIIRAHLRENVENEFIPYVVKIERL